MDAGTISFDCGHSYVWRPIALAEHEPLPVTGAHVLCATCLEAGLANKTAESLSLIHI